VPKRTYGDLEGDDGERQPPLFPARKVTKREMLEVLRVQAEDIHDLLQKVLGPQQRLLREQEERRMRALARSVVQEELFEQVAHPVVRKKADRALKPPAHSTYPDAAEFEAKVRATISGLCDPEQLDKLTAKRAVAEMNVTPNTLWGLLKDHVRADTNQPYAQPSETLARCLNRLADEWYPQWRGRNRQRF
jgi:hypothetical protein